MNNKGWLETKHGLCSARLLWHFWLLQQQRSISSPRMDALHLLQYDVAQVEKQMTHQQARSVASPILLDDCALLQHVSNPSGKKCLQTAARIAPNKLQHRVHIPANVELPF